MKIVVVSLLVYIATWLRTHRSMQMEIGGIATPIERISEIGSPAHHRT